MTTTSVTRNLSLNIAAVADAPSLSLTAPAGDNHLSRQIINTDWEQIANPKKTATIIPGESHQGWKSMDAKQGRKSVFEIWSSGDQMKNANNQTVYVNAQPGAGSNWLALTNNASDGKGQNLGITQDLDTQAGATYTLSLAYAGGLGLTAANSQIGIYLDDQLIAKHANTSSNSALNWQNLNFSFQGNGGNQQLRIQLEGGNGTSPQRQAMIDSIQLVETRTSTQNQVYGTINQPINLPQITSQLTDTDGSEALKTELIGLPKGITLSDGTKSITTTQTNQTVNLAGWKLNQLTLTASTGGSYTLTVKATSTEQSNQSSATTLQSFTVTILGGSKCNHPAGINPFVTYLNPGHQVEEDKPCIQATPLKPCNWLPESSTITLKRQPNGNNRDQQRTEVWLKERAEALSRAWVEELERFGKGRL